MQYRRNGEVAESYKMILYEIGDPLNEEEKELLGEISVGLEMENSLEDMIKEMEVEERWSKN